MAGEFWGRFRRFAPTAVAATADLPDDIAALKAMLIAAQAREVRKNEQIERLDHKARN